MGSQPFGLSALADGSPLPLGQALTADQVLSPHMFVFYASFVVTFALTPIMRSVALYFGIIDRPDTVRKMHERPIAYLGGVAVFLGWLSGVAMSRVLALHRTPSVYSVSRPQLGSGIVIAALIIIALGLWDDIHGISAPVKICGQVLAACSLLINHVGTGCTRAMLTGLLVHVGAAINHTNLLAEIGASWFDPLVLVSSSLLVVLVIVGSCNATNLMDGLDGLCSGVTAIIVVGLLFVGVHLAMNGVGADGNCDSLRVTLGLSLLGAVLGFIPFNFNPASIFMGDTGSMFLGFCCGTLMILMAQVQSKWFLAAMVMFALPMLDTALAFARRRVAGRPIFSADAQHLHHQLVQRGFTVRQTVMIEYGLSLIFAILGVAIVYVRTRYAAAVYMVTFACIIVAATKMGMVHERAGIKVPNVLPESDVEVTRPARPAPKVRNTAEAIRADAGLELAGSMA